MKKASGGGREAFEEAEGEEGMICAGRSRGRGRLNWGRRLVGGEGAAGGEHHIRADWEEVYWNGPW